MYVVSVDEQGPGHSWKEKIKELVDKETSRLGMSADILMAERGSDLLESLKTFIQEQPDIIFDFVLVRRWVKAARKHRAEERGERGVPVRHHRNRHDE